METDNPPPKGVRLEESPARGAVCGSERVLFTDQYFRGDGLTLNQRFSAPQKGFSEEELTLNQRFSSSRLVSCQTHQSFAVWINNPIICKNYPVVIQSLLSCRGSNLNSDSLLDDDEEELLFFRLESMQVRNE